MAGKIVFTGKEGREFYGTVRQRVEEYFRERNLSKNANATMVFKTVLFLGSLTACYLLIMLMDFPWYANLVLVSVLGLSAAFIGLNISHDAIHGSYSKHPIVNKILGFSFNMVGANAYMWSIMHNVVHHTFTNIPGIDEDIEPIPLIRISPDQKLKKIQRYQHIYAYFFYGLTSISWVLMKDFKKFYQKKIGNYDNKHHEPIEYFNLYFFKALYFTLFLVLPLVFLNMAIWKILLGFFIMHIFCGMTLAIVFMMAHIVEGPEFPSAGDAGVIDRPWAVHQMHTTADFARDNPFVNFFCGGLNFQIEHHLFPQVCHVHYQPISKIVEHTAKEFNLPYHDNPTFTGAIQSHTRLLKKFGRG